MTIQPQWGIDVTKTLVDGLEDADAKHGLKSALRVTPTDVREFSRPPEIRSGQYWESLINTFDGVAAAGAELLSIESVGGKEVHDEALTYGDISGVIFGLCVMGVRDMRFLWTAIEKVARKHGARSAGDTACGFGNTAMVLAEQKMISRVFAAVVRAVTAVRSLVAYECGAVGPGKDCGYENAILKAITGLPMAMEGKSAACAHLSPVGNIAAAVCDTWSNESVQNVKLLGGMAPTCYVEQLIYDCRLMNQSLAEGRDAARMYQRWMINSDAALDPQAYVLTPHSSVEIAKAIVAQPDPYNAGKAAALTAVRLLRDAHTQGQLKLSAREVPWLDTIQTAVEELPDTEATFCSQMMASVDTSKFNPADYEL
jgi:methanol--5-hydroxybenzimidazolylcobamide Co-methyltransferase